MGGCVSGEDEDVMLASSSGSAWLTFVSNMLSSTKQIYTYETQIYLHYGTVQRMLSLNMPYPSTATDD